MKFLETSWRPKKLNSRNIKKEINKIKKTHSKVEICDRHKEQLEEIFLLRNPWCRFDKNYKKELDKFVFNENRKDNGNWFYYPWLNKIVRVLPEILYLEMRTGRNRNLITKAEQLIYYKSKVAILGLSVGSHAALTIAMTGGAKNLILADPDTISGTNLNRIRTGASNLGISKSVLTARLISEINPYSDIAIFPTGVNDENINEILKVDVLVEEMDNPYFKIKVREIAKMKRVPVVMATDNGDNIFVDIERFDKEPRMQILNGLTGKLSSNEFKSLSPEKLVKIAARIAGARKATLRMQESVTQVGKKIYSWPQLGTAANLAGSAVAYLVRRIVLNSENIKSGRYEVNLDAIFESDYYDKKVVLKRKKKTEEFYKKMESR